MNRRRFLKGVAFSALAGAGAALFRQTAVAAGGSKPLKPDPNPKISLREICRRGLHRAPGGGFQNPFPLRVPPGNLGRLLKWKLFSKNHFSHLYQNEVVRPVVADWQAVRESPATSLTFIKHCAIMVKHAGRYVLVDPVFKDMFPLFSDFSPLGFAAREMPAPNHILITHGHYDHLSSETLELFDPKTHLVTPLGYSYVFDDLGMNNRHQLDWFGAWRGDGLEAILLPCNHWTMRNPLKGPNRSLWGGFLLRLENGPTIFISGDAAWFPHYPELAELGPIDLAIFNLGAYEPRWFMKYSHMNPREVADAFAGLNAKKLMVVHWGAYRLGDEPVYLPPLDMLAELEKRGQGDRFLRLDPGQTLFF